MKISLVVVGGTKSKELQSAITDYSSRLSHYVDFEFLSVSEEKLQKALEKVERIILLDEKGRESTSLEFSKTLEKQLNSSVRSMAFVIGGPFGFSEGVRAMAHDTMALSKMTLPHDLVRVVFMEQLYRAFTILRNEKYHHE